jgi:hypothetical protein
VLGTAEITLRPENPKVTGWIADHVSGAVDGAEPRLDASSAIGRSVPSRTTPSQPVPKLPVENPVEER